MDLICVLKVLNINRFFKKIEMLFFLFILKVVSVIIIIIMFNMVKGRIVIIWVFIYVEEKKCGWRDICI